ncbi:MAG: ABC transporter ATP-binding protein, partial [Oscillospiraceae bacterium]|nr:ABC transporter ATP-binding protein [Oscillospiraceae bacterium]
MIKMLKHLGKSAAWIPLIVALLIVQAFCDLALPQYTSDIVDVGIQQGGIETAALDEISPESMEKLLLFDKSGLLTKYYSKGDSDSYSRLYEAENVELHIAYPAAVVYALENADSSMLPEGTQLPEGMTLVDALLAMPEEQRAPMIEEINKSFEGYSDIMLSQMAIGFAQSELEAQGTDMDALRMNYIFKTGAKMMGMALLVMVVTIVVGFIAAQLGALFGMNVREKIFRKVISFSNSEMDKFSTASLITRSTNDIQQVQMVIVMILRMVLYAPIMGIGGVIKVVRTGTGMGWIIFIAVAAILMLVAVLMSVAMPKFKMMQKLIDRLNLVTREILTGLPVIRAFSREEYEEQRFDTANKNLMQTQLFTNRVMTVMMPFMTLIMNGISVLIVWFGAKGIDNGEMQVGDMMAFLTYTMQIVM